MKYAASCYSARLLNREPDWPGVWIAVCRMVSLRARRLFREVAAALPTERRWLRTPNDPQHTLRRYGPPPWGPLALYEPAKVLELHLVDSGLVGRDWVRLVRALRAQPQCRLLNVWCVILRIANCLPPASRRACKSSKSKD